ncbi:hypothetical protein Nepgr_006370 [Nepenthes gracilis]|uniref:Uncharacterized protein n=1 Tax=Nepenthes gracilis TaxID=150966 RepID=A0AAD3XHC6_NEPGR|nr:hypothetical protein Nepgr_006370 [Nepenthes gracilis]
MQNEAATAALSAGRYSGERGAGGKIRKPSSRKPPSRPYDRPRNEQRREKGGWISKIVDPAYRLIAGGATRLLPSIFSSPISHSSTSTLPHTVPPSDVANHDEGHKEVKQETRNDSLQCTTNLTVSKSTGLLGPGELRENLEVSDPVKDAQDKMLVRVADSRLSKIEQLIKESKFDREESNRLMEILKSRVVDIEQGRNIVEVNATEEVDRAEMSPEKSRKSSEEKPQDSDVVKLGTSTSIPQTTLQEIGALPVEIARAYMGSRTLEMGSGYTSSVPRDEIFSLYTDELAAKKFVPSPLPKSSICWPGAIMQDSPGYSTPFHQGGRIGLRTPYSRTIYSKSKSKLFPLRGDYERLLNHSSSPLQPMQTPLNGQSRINVTEDRYGSVGPIRGMRNKFISETPPVVSPLLRSSQRNSLQMDESSDHDDFLPKKTSTTSTSTFLSMEDKANSTEVGASSVHLQSINRARQILELISKPPTPKQKSEELKLVAAQRNFSSEPLSTVPNEQISLPHFGGLAQQNAFFKVPPQDSRADDVTGDAKYGASASKTFLRSASVLCDGHVDTSTHIQNANGSPIKSPHEVISNDKQTRIDRFQPLGNQSMSQDFAANRPPSVGSGVLNLQKMAVSSGTKPVFPSIFVGKSNIQTTLSSDNNTGFTFPVTTSSTSYEPPTPSVMPSSLTSALPQLSKTFIPPMYNFGNRKSNMPIVFSFPSTSAASTSNDAPDINFRFIL